MNRMLALAPAAVAALALTFSPALAAPKKHRIHQGYAQPHYGNPVYGPFEGWTSRNVSSDPSFGNRAGIDAARRSGRCVEDLGYGRYEYCGW